MKNNSMSYIYGIKSNVSVFYRNILLVLFGTFLLTLSAKINVPFFPVPLTLQTLVVLLIPGLYGARLGVTTISLYLLQGAVGLPVFASGGGIAYFFGPTGGYLMGFLVASYVIGKASDKGHNRHFKESLIWFFIGHFLIFGFGIFRLSFLMDFDNALKVGFYPFIYGAILKFSLAALIIDLMWRRRKNN